VKSLSLLTVPFGVVTIILPVVAFVGTTAVIIVADTTVTVAEAVPLNVTAVVPVKFVPFIVTVSPYLPLVGEKLVIVGGGFTVKVPALVTVPPGVVTTILPVVAFVGTTAVIDVADTTETVAEAIPLNVTAVAPEKLVPVIVTTCP